MRLSAFAAPAWLACVLTISSAAVSAQPLGSSFTYQGRLTDAGQSADGLYDLQVCLFDSPTSPVAIACPPDFDDVPVEDGVFTLALDFGSTPFIGQQRYIELRVRPGGSTGGYTILTPRQLVRATPEALRSNVSSAAPWSGLTGVPAGFADGVDDNSGGTVTSITAGAGLSGGTITGSGSIGIATGGVGAAQIAPGAVGLAQVNTAQVQARVSGNCGVGQYVRAVGADGSVTCGSDAVGGAGTVTSITAGTGLSGGTITGSGVIGIANGGVGSAQIAAAAVGTAQVNPAQVQVRVAGNCPIGHYLRVVNADGSVICDSVLAYLGINLKTIVDDPDEFVGEVENNTSIAVGSDGLPVISYFVDGVIEGAIRVAKCANAACTGATTISTLASGWPSFYRSIAIGADGLPVIAFDGPSGTLQIARCANAACTGTSTITTVDDPPANEVGAHNAIAIGSDGLPVISYQDSSAGALKVAKCANAACTGLATITTVDDHPVQSLGEFSDIAIGADGLPVISYINSALGALKVAKCANAACTGVATITTVDDPSNTLSGQTSIAIGPDGLPVIAYRDETAQQLKIAKCVNQACTGTATITSLTGGRFASIAIGADGLPVVSSSSSTGDRLFVTKCGSPECFAFGSTVSVVDGPDSTLSGYTSIAIGIDGLPVVSYIGALSSLKVAKCGTPGCR